jgi:hypothetical protein
MPGRQRVVLALASWALAWGTPAAAGGADQAALTGPRAVLTLIERDLDGDAHDVPRDRATVDINSLLSVGVDRGALVARLPSPPEGSLTSALITDYAMFQKGVTAMTSATEPYGRKLNAIRAAPAGDARNKAIVDARPTIRTMSAAAGPLLDYALATDVANPAAKERRMAFRQELREALRAEMGKSLAAHFVAIQTAGRNELKRLDEALRAALAKEGVHLMMGAWINTVAGTRAVHLPGFDDYPDQPRHEVERFSLVFTPEQKQQYENARAAATLVNSGGGGDVVNQMALDFVNRSFPDSLKALQDVQVACQAFMTIAKDVPKPVVAGTKTLMAHLTDDLKWLEGTIASLEEIAKNNPGGLRQAIQVAVDAAIARVNTIKTDADLLKNYADAAKGVLKTSSEGVLQAIKALDTAVTDNLGALWDGVKEAAIGRDLNAASLAFGDKVKRFDLDNLPATTQLDLELTGQRADGDHVAIKVGMERPGLPAQDLEVQSLVLRRLLVHVETAAGLVFATRPRQGVDASGKVPFQAAPAYSAFLKKGWRGCALWNNVLTPGLGVSMAALDFDLNGVPEVGIGGALSILRDWLQGGVGFNVFQRSWYGFIGIGLPLPTFGMTTVSNTGAAGAGAGAGSAGRSQ